MVTIQRSLFLFVFGLVMVSLLLKGSGIAPIAGGEGEGRGARSFAPSRALLPILLYHRISDRVLPRDGGRLLPIEALRAQLRYLKANDYTTLHFADYLAIRRGDRPCPKRPIILTFDDGFADNFYEAYPLLKKFGFKAVFYPIVGAVGKPGHLTWKKWALIDQSVIEIGSHTMTHPGMKGMSLKPMLRQVVESKEILEAFFGEPCLSFAFPYGSYDDRAVEAVKAAGYAVAVNSDRGLNAWGDDLYRLKRFSVRRGLPLARLARWIGGPSPLDPAD